MKIIATDNFHRDSVADWLVAENIKDEAYARTIADALNTHHSGPDASWYFVAVPDDRVLSKGLEDMI